MSIRQRFPAVTTPRYDRAATSRIIAGLAGPGLFTTPPTITSGTVPYRAHRMVPEPDSHLTLSQRLYLERFMRPCPPAQVSSATHRMTWTDSDGVPSTGHFQAGGLGPIVAIAVRETTVSLWHALADDHGLAARIAALSDDDRSLLAATTTDHDPLDIFRIGIEATGRALAQHALLAAQTPYRSPAEFAYAMARGGLFAAVAGQWYWELQASTFRRGMIPVRLAATPEGTIRYSAETVSVLRQMKDATIAGAHAVMDRAITTEAMTVDQAVQHYHDELDLISRQYALLPEGTRPHCLAQPTVLPAVVETYVATFARVVEKLEVTEDDEPESEPASDDWLFHVPDMNCRHCQTTIRGALESMDIDVREVDLVSKRVVAEFRSARNRERAFAAIRDSGYTVLSGS
jgi:copper chaperone CopZ